VGDLVAAFAEFLPGFLVLGRASSIACSQARDGLLGGTYASPDSARLGSMQITFVSSAMYATGPVDFEEAPTWSQRSGSCGDYPSWRLPSFPVTMI